MSTPEKRDPERPEQQARALEVIPARALDTITRAEIDTQIATAKKYPRDDHAFANKLLQLATIDKETAESCFYALPRRERQEDGSYKKKVIRGESVRLTELAASAFGNFRSGGRVIEETDDFIVAQGIAHDLESNNFTTTEVRRKITDRSGRRYSADMITLTANAACAIAVRNARLQIIGRARLRDAYLRCLHIVAGNLETLGARRDAAIKHFVDLGISKERVFVALELTGPEGFTPDHLTELVGFANAVRDGETTLAEIFPAATPTESRDDALAAALKGGKKDDAPDPAATGTQATASEKKGGGKAQPDLPGTKREPGED